MQPLTQRLEPLLEYPVIGFAGRAGAGKSYLANRLHTEFPHNSSRYSMAKPLKTMTTALMDALEQDAHPLDGQDAASREWREQPNDLLSSITGERCLTPRKFLQEFGTDCVRAWHQDFWVRCANWQITRNKANGIQTIIDDVRFNDECELIRWLGGVIVYVNRPLAESREPSKTQHAKHASEHGVSVHLIDFIYTNQRLP